MVAMPIQHVVPRQTSLEQAEGDWLDSAMSLKFFSAVRH